MKNVTGQNVNLDKGNIIFVTKDGQAMSLSSEEVMLAISRFARRNDYYARTVRTVTGLRRKALAEWCADH